MPRLCPPAAPAAPGRARPRSARRDPQRCPGRGQDRHRERRAPRGTRGCGATPWLATPLQSRVPTLSPGRGQETPPGAGLRTSPAGTGTPQGGTRDSAEGAINAADNCPRMGQGTENRPQGGERGFQVEEGTLGPPAPSPQHPSRAGGVCGICWERGGRRRAFIHPSLGRGAP